MKELKISQIQFEAKSTHIKNAKLLEKYFKNTNLINKPSKIDELIGDFELENTLDLKAKNLSGGQKKKLAISLSLIAAKINLKV